ncbi:MAG: transcription termination/antitermination protein NusA [Verrucomicrobiae bacterium]|nr:transcription termination/antitermination protein NusA [Verrucomicrobiae bacterium]
MTNELLALFEYYEKEKGIDRMTMVEALEGALLSASRKSIGPARELKIHIDPQKGKIKVTSTLVIVDRVMKPYDEIDIFTARRIRPESQVGEELEVEVTPKNFGRIAAQTAKQAMMQRLRQAEKEMIYDEFKDRAGDIVSGTVRRFERSDVMIDLGKFEGVMPSRERVSTEEYNIGDRIRAYVVAVENGPRGPEIILSRSHPNFVRRLFESEVSEIADHTVEIRALARESGYRTKVAVYSADEKVDPVGACVGLRGARVKNIVRELNNEKVDIIRWSDNTREFVEDALKPAKIRSIELDEENHRVRVTVDEEELSKAIGRRGQNARLTSRLVGWDVQVEKDESAHEAFEARVSDAANGLAERVGIDVELAMGLVRGGINTLEMLANDVDAIDVAEILEVSEEEGADILARAQAAFGGNAEPAADEAEEPAAESDDAPVAEAGEEAAAESTEESADEAPAEAAAEEKAAQA